MVEIRVNPLFVALVMLASSFPNGGAVNGDNTTSVLVALSVVEKLHGWSIRRSIRSGRLKLSLPAPEEEEEK